MIDLYGCAVFGFAGIAALTGAAAWVQQRHERVLLAAEELERKLDKERNRNKRLRNQIKRLESDAAIAKIVADGSREDDAARWQAERKELLQRCNNLEAMLAQKWREAQKNEGD